MAIREAVACIRKNRRFLITSHINPEGDALGSELALFTLLKKLGKSACIINEDSLPYGYDFLPKKSKIKKFRPGSKGIRFDCLAVLDCSDLKRAGEVAGLSTGSTTVLNIDHHVSNAMFADVNWVEPHASSCSEMIYKLYKRLRVPFDRDSAIFLYTGMMTDTGSFRYSNTSSSTHRAASELLRFNLNASKIYKNIYENVPFKEMKLLTQILPGLRLSAQGRIAYCEIRRGMLKGKKLSFDLTEEILRFARAIKGIEVVVLFKENLGGRSSVRINLRSRGRVDVNRIASCFGGGGHKTASGATVCGVIGQVRRKVLAKIAENL